MKIIYSLLILAALLLAVSPLKAQLPFYLPTGEKYTGKAQTIREINHELEKRGRVYIHNAKLDDEKNVVTVGYKLFTKQPLWVLVNDSTTVKAAIESFDLDELLGTWRFKMELEEYVKKKVIDDGFLLETLGKPEKMTTYYSNNVQFDRWAYSYPDVVFTLKKGIVTSYIVNE